MIRSNGCWNCKNTYITDAGRFLGEYDHEIICKLINPNHQYAASFKGFIRSCRLNCERWEKNDLVMICYPPLTKQMRDNGILWSDIKRYQKRLDSFFITDPEAAQ